MGRLQPPSMGEEDEAAGAYSPRTLPTCQPGNSNPASTQIRTSEPKFDKVSVRTSDTVVGGFWAPRDDVRHWSRQTQTWSLPALFHVFGNSWTMKELYGIWCEMPLVLKSPKRGAGPTMKEHLGNRQKTHDDVVHFLDANNLGRPQSSLEWRQCYREVGKFLAMKAFLTNTPQVVMEHMIMRAICDERISLPMEYPEVYAKIAEVIPVGDMMDVKVAWRCNTSQVPSTTSWATVQRRSQQWA